jgi:hypothetical protein
MSLIQTGSTKLRRGKPLKSIWTTAASWFSNTPEKGAQASRLFSKSKKPPPNRILAKRSGKLRSRQMNVPVKTRNGHRDTAVASRFSSLLSALC